MRCKVGDLAVIVNVADKRFSDNIGKIVRCVKLWGESDMHGWMWHIHAEGAPLHVCNTETKIHFMCEDGLHSDDNLRPIRGEEEIKKEEIFIDNRT